MTAHNAALISLRFTLLTLFLFFASKPGTAAWDALCGLTVWIGVFTIALSQLSAYQQRRDKRDLAALLDGVEWSEEGLIVQDFDNKKGWY